MGHYRPLPVDAAAALGMARILLLTLLWPLAAGADLWMTWVRHRPLPQPPVARHRQ